MRRARRGGWRARWRARAAGRAGALGSALLVLALATGAVRGQQGAPSYELYLGDGQTLLTEGGPPPASTLPVLFVHGHNLASADDSDFNFRKNWIEAGGITSFKAALDLPANAALGIEPYFIRLIDQNRSIVEDARDIGEAIARIQRRHDPSFDVDDPTDPNDSFTTTPVKVAVIAYSKGTISIRLFLKSLSEDVSALDPAGILGVPRPDYRPVSEFIAISPPNHGTVPGGLFNFTQSLALQQLFNGYRENCFSFGPPAEGFIAALNGHPIEDTLQAVGDVYPGEAPGSRGNGEGIAAGTLYLTAYDALGRDTVGGNPPSSDCQGRKVARNLAPGALNMEIAGIPDSGSSALPVGLRVHANTPHTPEVICRALYTAVHHRAPVNADGTLQDASQICSWQGDAPPAIEAAAGTSAVLALDQSGSMAAPACPGCASKAAILADAAALFLDLWSLVGTPEDRVGVAYFRSGVGRYHDPASGDDLVPVLPDAAAVIADITAKSANPGGMTAMGGALQSAIDTLEGMPGKRHVILFTDGMQNVNPMVTGSGPGGLRIDQRPGYPQSNVQPSSPPTALDANLGIAVDTIGVGAGAGFQPLLGQIAVDTGGLAELTVDPVLIREFFVNQLINALRGSSPQLVAYRRGILAGTSAAEPFPINNTAGKALFAVSWQPGRPVRVRIEKDGRDLTAEATRLVGAHHLILSFAFPLEVNGRRVAAGGEWRVVIEGEPGAGYEAAAIVDDKVIRYRGRVGRRLYRAGEPIELSAELLAGDRSLAAEAVITASVRAPRESIANLLARNPARIEAAGTSGEPLTGRGQAALGVLLQDPAVWRRLRAVTSTQPLPFVGRDKAARGVFTATEVPGVYTVTFRLRAEDAELGMIERTETVSALVGVGRIDAAASDIHLRELAVSPRGREVELTIRPRDRLGNYLGPDQAARIALALSQGEGAAWPLDLGDGRYLIAMVVPPRSDPELALVIAGEEIFSGPLSRLPTPPSMAPLWIGLTIFVVGGVALAFAARVTMRRASPVLGRTQRMA